MHYLVTFENNDRFCFIFLLIWLFLFFFTLPMRKYKMNINEGSKIHYLHCICLIHKFRIQWDRHTNRTYWKPISRTMAVDRLSFFFTECEQMSILLPPLRYKSFVHVLSALLNVRNWTSARLDAFVCFCCGFFFWGGAKVEDAIDAILYWVKQKQLIWQLRNVCFTDKQK